MRIIKDTTTTIHNLVIELDVKDVPSKNNILKLFTTPNEEKSNPSTWSIDTFDRMSDEILEYLMGEDDDFIYSSIPDGTIPQVHVIYEDETFRGLMEHLMEEVFWDTMNKLPLDHKTKCQIVGVDMLPHDETIKEFWDVYQDSDKEVSMGTWLVMNLNGTLEEEGYVPNPIKNIEKVLVSEGSGSKLVPLEVYVDHILDGEHNFVLDK